MKLDIRILPVTDDDRDAVTKFLQRYFFPGEPLNRSLQRNPSSDDIPFIKDLAHGLSLKAVNVLSNAEDNMAGLIINKEITFENKIKMQTIKCPKRSKIYKILLELDERSKIWEKVNNETHLHVAAMAVSDEYRGLKIGQKLLDASLDLARTRRYNYASIECSSFFSAEIATKMGFELLAEIPYDEYLDENGERIFDIQKPHVALKKLYKIL